MLSDIDWKITKDLSCTCPMSLHRQSLTRDCHEWAVGHVLCTWLESSLIVNLGYRHGHTYSRTPFEHAHTNTFEHTHTNTHLSTHTYTHIHTHTPQHTHTSQHTHTQLNTLTHSLSLNEHTHGHAWKHTQRLVNAHNTHNTTHAHTFEHTPCPLQIRVDCSLHTQLPSRQRILNLFLRAYPSPRYRSEGQMLRPLDTWWGHGYDKDCD